MILVHKHTEFGQGGGFVGAAAQFGSVQAGGFDAHENPVCGWRGGFGVGMVDGEAGGWRLGAWGGEDCSGHGAGWGVGPGRHGGGVGLEVLGGEVR